MTPEDRAQFVDDQLMEAFEPTDIDFARLRQLVTMQIREAVSAAYNSAALDIEAIINEHGGPHEQPALIIAAEILRNRAKTQ